MATDELLDAYLEAEKAHRTINEFHKARILSQLRRDYFARKDAALTEAQLDGKDVRRTLSTEPKFSVPSIHERTLLANLIGSEDMRSASMQAQRAAAIQAMVDLCSRVELKRRAEKRSSCRPEIQSEDPTRSTQEGSVPMKCHHLQCLAMSGSPSKTAQGSSASSKHSEGTSRTISTPSKLVREYPVPIPYVKRKVWFSTVRGTSRIMRTRNTAHDYKFASYFLYPSSFVCTYRANDFGPQNE